MTDVSPHLALSYLLPAQAQKHVTVNEALARLDLVVQAAVIDRSLTVPPAAPAEGARHIVAAGATGAWAGQDGRIAHHVAGVWSFVAPQAGWRVAILAELQVALFDGALWRTPDSLTLRVTQLGVAGDADATNRLAVAAPATLLSHAGAGHQVKVNKAAPGDTASLLFQTGFSGRAELGLAGSDGFSVKTSADGTTWNTALTADPATGIATLAGGLRLPNGTASAPAAAFTSDIDTGFYRAGTDALGVAAGGVERARVTTAGLQVTGLISGTAVTQTNTDATAGRLLKVGDFGLGGDGAQVTDLNTVIVNGLYKLAGSATNAPAGITTSSLLVVRFGALVQQWLFEGASVPRLWMRRSADSGATWPTAWRTAFTSGNVLAAVSQAGGVPTGGLIERATNANGTYVRLADGTQICTSIPFTADVTTAAGSGFRSAAVLWTFPAAFSTATGLLATGNAPNNETTHWVSARALSVTEGNLVLHGWTSQTGRQGSAMAIGRWF